MNSTPDNHEENAAEADRGLSPKQERAIIALLNEPTIAKAAQQAEVAERTLRRWLEDDKFSRAFRKARREAFGHGISLMQHYVPHAVNTLAKVMSDATAPHSARVSAASTTLKFSREAIELDDLAARVELLEQAAAKSDKTRGR